MCTRRRSIPRQVYQITAVYHGQFGFGSGYPVTDIVLKNISGKTVTLGGPHSAAISTHEFYTPTAPSLEQIQHKQQQK